MAPVERSPVSRALRAAVTLVWAVAVSLLVLAAAYVGIGRYLVTQVGVYEADLEQTLSQRLGRPVHIEALTGSWTRLDPVIRVSGLTVGDRNRPDAALQRLRLRLDTLASLVRGRLVFSELSARHADLTLTQYESGQLGLNGLWLPDGEGQPQTLEAAARAFDERFADWIEELGAILSNPVMRVADLRLTVETPDEENQYFQVPAVELAFHDGTFSASGRLTQVNSAETVARFSIRGKHFFSGEFDGKLYLDIRSEHLFDTLLRRYDWYDVGVQGLDLQTAAWLTFTDGHLTRARADIATPYLQLRSASATLPPLENLKVTLTARRLENGWELQAKDLRYRWLGEVIGPLSGRWQNSGEGWRLAIDRLPIRSAAELVAGLEILPEALREALRNYRPGGRLERLTVDYVNAGQYWVTSDLRHVSVDAYEGAPGVDGLDGWLEHSAAGGRVVFDSPEIVFGFPELFAGAWQFRRMTGAVAWRPEGPGWRIGSDDIRFAYTGQTRLAGAFELLLSPEQDNRLSLQIGLANGSSDHVAQFVPVGAVGESLYEWLSAAMVAGEVPWGWYYGQGSIGADADSAFRSAMVYDFRALEFAYAEDWPAVTGAAGQFRYQGDLGWVDLEQGMVGGLNLRPSTVRIDAGNDVTRVGIHAGAPVTGEDLRFWLENTPLGDAAGAAAGAVSISGTADLALDLTLFPDAPEGQDKTTVTADVSLNDLTVAHPDMGLTWSGLTGQVRYDSATGLSSEDLTGRFLDHAVRLQLSGGAGDSPIAAHQWGRLEIAALSEWLGRPLTMLAGAADYDLYATLGPEPALEYRVNLVDIAVDLPPPLAKPLHAEGTLEGRLSVEGDDLVRLRGHWDDRIAYQFIWHNGQFERGKIALGADRALFREGGQEEGLVIVGKAWKLDLDQWYRRLPGLIPNGTDVGPEEMLSTAGFAIAVEIETANLILGGRNFGAVILDLRPEGDGWRIEAEGERLAGTALWRPGGMHSLDLARLKIPPADAGSELALEPPEPGDPPFPDIDVRIDELWLDGKPYGSWRFKLRSAAGALLLEEIEARTGSLTFTGGLQWRYGQEAPAAARRGVTHVEGTLEGGDIRDLNAWIEAGVPLDSERTEARLTLSWPGPPQAFTLASIAGELALRLEEGTILDQNNAAQIFRIFGILNADTLMRRLRLDFSDLYQAGVTFEAVSGSAVVDNGILTLDPELQLVGPSGAFRLTGSTDLINETLNMRLVVALPLTQNLPVAALLLGAAAPVGGALFILDKLLGDPLSKLTSATYDVTGNWQEPEVTLRSMFDTGSDVPAADAPRPNKDVRELNRSIPETGVGSPVPEVLPPAEEDQSLAPQELAPSQG